jgi:hypothetical protein
MGFSIFAKAKLKIGFLISYDWQYIFNALPIVYAYADEIILAIDANRLSWAGKKYDFDEFFFERIKALDKDRKITIFEDNFYIESLSPIENETRERNLLSEKMGTDCWKIQIDVDEYFVDFDAVCRFLQKHSYLLSKPKYNAVNIRGSWITLFKKTQNGYLYIDNDEHFSFATNLVGAHFFGRDLASRTNREIYTGFEVIHQSWAREPEEILQKINNWGHKDDFDTQAYFQFWKHVDETNYAQFENLHPVYPEAWKSLKFIACSDIHDFCVKFHANKSKPAKLRLPAHYFKKYIKNSLKLWRR